MAHPRMVLRLHTCLQKLKDFRLLLLLLAPTFVYVGGMNDITPPEGFSKDSEKPGAVVPTLEVVYAAVQAVASRVEGISKNCEKEENQKQQVADATNRLLSAADEVRRVADVVKTNVRPLNKHAQLNTFVAVMTLALVTLHLTLTGRFMEFLVLPAAALVGFASRFVWRT
jgi:hypothetical protein